MELWERVRLGRSWRARSGNENGFFARTGLFIRRRPSMIGNFRLWLACLSFVCVMPLSTLAADKCVETVFKGLISQPSLEACSASHAQIASNYAGSEPPLTVQPQRPVIRYAQSPSCNINCRARCDRQFNACCPGSTCPTQCWYQRNQCYASCGQCCALSGGNPCACGGCIKERHRRSGAG